MANVVIPFHEEFLACFTVCVEMPGNLAIHPMLTFGPFNTKQQAYDWLEAVERVYSHKKVIIELRDEYDTGGLPRIPYTNFLLSDFLVRPRPRKPSNLGIPFSPEKPEIVEPKLGKYAVRLAYARLDHAVELLDRESVV